MTRRRYAGIEDLGVKRGPFYVLVGAFMPCVLVETSFLTHPVEGRRMADGRFVAEKVQAKCASKYEAAPGEGKPGYGKPENTPAAPSGSASNKS